MNLQSLKCRAVAITLIASLVYTPVYAASENTKQSAQAGQTFANEHADSIGASDGIPAGDFFSFSGEGGQQQSIQELFPGVNSETDSEISELQELGRSDDDLNQAGLDSQAKHRADSRSSQPTATGAAYEIVERAAQDGRQDLSYDPSFSQTKAVYENPANYFPAGMFEECQAEDVVTPTTKSIHMPDYQYCRVLKKLTQCDVDRKVSVEEHTQEWSRSAGCFTSRTYSFPVGHAKTMFKGHVTHFDVSAVNTSAELTEAPSMANGWVATVQAFGNRQSVRYVEDRIATENKYVKLDDNGHIVLDEEGKPVYETEIVYSCAPGWKLAGTVCEQFRMECPAPASLNFSLGFYGKYLKQTVDHLPHDDGVNTCIMETDDFTAVEWECQDRAPRTIDGEVIGPERLALLDNLYPDDPGSSEFVKIGESNSDRQGSACWFGEGTYNAQTGGPQYQLGTSDPWISPDGTTHQFTATADETVLDNCTALRESPECKLYETSCVGGASGHNNFCYVEDYIYDCGKTHVVENSEIETLYHCPGDISCMGEECIEQQKEASSDFLEASAALQAAQHIAQDTDGACQAGSIGIDLGRVDQCVNSSDKTYDECLSEEQNFVAEYNGRDECRVFSGEAFSCKKALFGYVDCCNNPTNVSLGNYLGLVLAMPKLDSAITNIEGDNALAGLKGAYNTMRDPVADTFTSISQPFTSFTESIGGAVDTVTTSVSEFAGSVVNNIKGQVSNLAGNAISGGGPGVGSPVAAAAQEGFTETMLGAPGAQALQMLNTAYTVYVVANLVINIIWECTDDEFTYAANRDLQKCTTMQSYCAKKPFLSPCLEHRYTSCCFSTPLSRIIQEQGRPQLGLDFGSAEHRTCGGFTIQQLSQLDWSNIDLSEWTGLLDQNDLIPNQDNINLERRTGQGNAFNHDGSRTDAQGRTQQRMEGIDSKEVQQNVSDDIRNNYVPSG